MYRGRDVLKLGLPHQPHGCRLPLRGRRHRDDAAGPRAVHKEARESKIMSVGKQHSEL